MTDEQKAAILAEIVESYPYIRPSDIKAEEYIAAYRAATGVTLPETTAWRHLDGRKDLERVPGVYDPDSRRTRTVWRKRA